MSSRMGLSEPWPAQKGSESNSRICFDADGRRPAPSSGNDRARNSWVTNPDAFTHSHRADSCFLGGISVARKVEWSPEDA
jgi:hypothetical protein